MLRAVELKKRFGDSAVLSGVTFEIAHSVIAGVIGPSGGGKSVLLKILGNISAPDSGTISYGLSGEKNTALMFQEGALFDSISVFDNVAFPLVHGKVPTTLLPRREQRRVRDQVFDILTRVGLGNAAFKMPGQLSGGMRRRVSLARALVARPPIVLLDDPTCGLDPVSSSVIMDLIVELHREYRPTMVLVSHDLRRLLPVLDTVLALFHGKMIFRGSVDELLECDIAEVREFVACRYDIDPHREAPVGQPRDV